MAIPYTFAGQSGVIPLAELDSNFAHVGDSSGVTYVPAGTSAVATTVQAALRQVVNVTDFGADPTGAVNCNTAFANAVTYAKTLTAPELIINPGTYTANNVLNFDLPNYSTITFLGTITSSVSSNPAIRIGGTGTNTFGLTVTGIKVQRSTNDTTSGSSGVQLRNISSSYVDVRLCTGFQDGIFCYGDQANGGFSYNEVHMGRIHDNKRNVYLNAGSVGYCNENNFYGGTLNHSTSYPAVATTNLEIANFATATLNNNRFYGPSFEDNTAGAVAAIINGSNNVIYWPRMENPANQTGYQIQFTVNSIECRVIGHGFAMVNSNISDVGVGNMYETREGAVMRFQTPATAGKAVLKLQGYNTSTATVLSVLDSGGVETAKITGVGEAKFTGTTRALAIYNTSGYETAYVTGAGDAYFNSITGPVSINLTGPVTSVGAATTIVGPIPAVSLSGTISGAGNQINNIVIGATSPLAGSFTSLSASSVTVAGTLAATTLTPTNALGVAYGGTNATTASITSFNNITGYTASGATGTTSTNLVFSASPTITGTLGAAAITASSTLQVTGDTSVGTKILVGGPTTSIYAYGSQLYGSAANGSSNAFQWQYSANTTGASLLFAKTRGSTATDLAAAANGDTIGSISFGGSDGAAIQARGAFTGLIDGAVSAGTVPTAFSITTGTTVGTERIRITSAGLMGIGTSTPASSAIVDVTSTTLGFKFPVMTTTQKNAIASPVAGLVVFDSTLSKLCVYSGSAWQTITSV